MKFERITSNEQLLVSLLFFFLWISKVSIIKNRKQSSEVVCSFTGLSKNKDFLLSLNEEN